MQENLKREDSMSLEGFCAYIRLGIQQRMGQAYHVATQNYVKNNGVTLPGLTVMREESNLSPRTSDKCATIILPKMKEAKVDISDANGIVCSLSQVEVVDDVILVSDTDKLDSLNDGIYKVSILCAIHATSPLRFTSQSNIFDKL